MRFHYFLLCIFYLLFRSVGISQNDKVLDFWIIGDVRQLEVLVLDSNDLLANVLLENFIIDTPKIRTLTDGLALAILSSKQGHLSKADQFWTEIQQRRPLNNSTHNFFLGLEYAAHLVRKNEYIAADSIYTSLAALIIYDKDYPLPLMAYFQEQRAFAKYLLNDLALSTQYFKLTDSLWSMIDYFHPWRINYYNHYGLLQSALGAYDLADSLFLVAMDLSAKTSLTQVMAADAYSNYGNLQRILGDDEEAIYWFERAGAIYNQKMLFLESATILNNLALSYDQMDSIDLAIDNYRKALSIYEQQLGQRNIAYVTILNNLAGLYDYNEEYDKAKQSYRKCLQFTEALLGQDNTYFTTIMSNLGLLYENIEQPDSAELLYLQARDIRKKVLGVHHPRYLELVYNLAGLYSYWDPPKSLPIYEEVNARQLELIKYYYSSFDEDTRIDYLDYIFLEFERYFSTVVQNPSPAANKALLNFHLQTKGLATQYSLNARAQVAEGSVAIFEQWQQLRDSLAYFYLLGVQELSNRGIDLLAYQHRADQLESKWVRSYASDRTIFDFEKLKEILHPDELAIDFIRFEWYENGLWQDSVVYYAIVVDPNLDYPRVISLCNEFELKELVSYGSYPLQYKEQQEGLSDGLIEPLRSMIVDKKTIYFSPTGYLHHVPFHALKLDSQFLIEQYDVQYVVKLNDLMEIKTTCMNGQDHALLVGDLEFGVDTQAGNYQTYFKALPGTRDEIAQVKKILKSPSKQITELTNINASSSTILDVLENESYSILHFATHGYSYRRIHQESNESLQSKIMTSSNSLIRTGLVLSSANTYWRQPILSARETGLLNGFQIANLDLSCTELVVLSACASGTGDIHPTEGVFGLPRAFRLSGAQNVLFTIWNIDDKTTSIFIQEFYHQLAENQSIHQAFRNTQLYMLSTYDPFHWAGFILLL